MANDDAKTRWSAPRLIGGVAALGVLALGTLVFSGGASAVVGNTDLALTKSGTPDQVVAGSNVTYTITVSNTGAMDASDVVVTDTLPADVDFVSATPSQGTCKRTGKIVTCELGQVNAGANATVIIVVGTKRQGTLSNTAVVASPNDTNATNNSDTEQTVVLNKGQGKPAKPSCAAPTITGTAGDDLITGTADADVIVTFTGNDQVFAGGGKDLVCTDGGADAVFGNGAGDTLIGGTGPDRLVGGKGGDLLKGKNGRDRLKGKAGNDTLNGGKKRDRCKGGPGHDVLISCP